MPAPRFKNLGILWQSGVRWLFIRRNLLFALKIEHLVIDPDPLASTNLFQLPASQVMYPLQIWGMLLPTCGGT